MGPQTAQMQSHEVPQCDSPLEYKHPGQAQIFQMELEVLLVCSPKECFEPKGYHYFVPCFAHIPYVGGFVLGHHTLSSEDCSMVGCTSA